MIDDYTKTTRRKRQLVMKNFTFRKEKKETGLRAIGHPYPNTVIKLNGKMVGMIYAPDWSTKSEWKIMLMVNVPSGPNCNWSWITLNYKPNTEAEARAFLIKNNKTIQERYDLRQTEDDW